MSKKIAALLMCPVILLGGCRLPFQKEEADGSGYTFTYTLTDNPDNLDPQIANNSAAFTVLRNTMQGLLEEKPDGSLSYGVASHYSITEDGLKYTFTLRNNSFWYTDENKNDAIDDGERWLVTADDFVFAFHRLFSKETRSPFREYFRCISGADDIIDNNADVSVLGVTAETPNTLVFTLARPCAEFLNLLAMPAAMPCSQKFFDRTDGRYGLDENSVISNSGFYMRKWFYDPYGNDNLIYLGRNSANNTVQRVYPKDLTFLIRNSQTKADGEFTSGRADILSTSVYHPEYAAENGYTVSSWRSVTLGLLFNTECEAFSNRDIRGAFSVSVPRKKFGDSDTEDIIGANGIVPPETRLGTSQYSSYVSGSIIPEMSEEDISALFRQGMYAEGLTSLQSADILICEGTVSEDYIYDIIQVWQSLFGFYAGIESVSESEFRERITEKDYTIALCGITGVRNNAADVLKTFGTGNNIFGYSDSDLDSVLENMDNARDWSELSVMCRQAEQMIADKYIFSPVFYKNRYLIYGSKNRDVEYDPYSDVLNFRNTKYFAE